MTEMARGRTLHLTSYEMLWPDGTYVFNCMHVVAWKFLAAGTSTRPNVVCILQEEMQLLQLYGAIPSPDLQLSRYRYDIAPRTSYYAHIISP